MIGLALIPLVILGLVAYGIHMELKSHGYRKVAWRWFTGHTHHGEHFTNAGWFKRADHVFVSRPVNRWHHLPRAERALIRTGSTVGIAGIVAGVFLNRGLTILALMICGGIALGFTGVWGFRRARKYYNQRDVISPLAVGLSQVLGIPPVSVQKGIDLPPSYLTQRKGKLGEIAIPETFRADPGQREAAEHLIGSRLPVDVTFQWQTKRKPMAIRIYAAPKPPSMVSFLSLVKEMEACKPGQLVMGLDRDSDVFYGSFDMDDPHWGASCKSGSGKSTWLMMNAAQILHNDDAAMIVAIDPKRTSFDPLSGVPGIVIACDPLDIGQMWGAIGSVYDEMMRRLEKQKEDPSYEPPGLYLFLDESNTFSAMSSTHWAKIKNPFDKATPPIWAEKIAPILWMGRQANVHAIFVGQRLDERSTGGIGLRDSLGFRALSGYRANQWMMLVGTTPIPRAQKGKGRWCYDDGSDEVTWVQNMLADPDKRKNAEIIRDYAIARTHVERVTPVEAPEIILQVNRTREAA